MKNKESSYIDVCFLVASSAKKSYQKLSETYSAIESPTWSLLLAQSCRSIGFKVSIIDANAENLSNNEIFKKINDIYIIKFIYITFIIRQSFIIVFRC